MELAQFGWNAVTIGLLGTILFGFVEAWGLWEQKREIWLQKSGQSLSVTWIVYGACLMTAGVLYGLSKSSIALIVGSGLPGLMHIPILIGLGKFKGFTKRERVLFGSLIAALVLMAIVPRKDWFFLLFAFGSIASSAMQPIEMWKNKNAGVVAVKLIGAYLLGTVFWVLYAFAIGDWVLMIICPAYLVILTATLCLWATYRRSARN